MMNAYSLARQTNKDFELVMVDELWEASLRPECNYDPVGYY